MSNVKTYLNAKTKRIVKVDIRYVPENIQGDLVEHVTNIEKPEILKQRKVKDNA